MTDTTRREALKGAGGGLLAALGGFMSGSSGAVGRPAQYVNASPNVADDDWLASDGPPRPTSLSDCWDWRHLRGINAPERVEQRMFEARRQARDWIDPDIECRRSMSETAKFRTQVERNYLSLTESERASLMGEVKRWRERFGL